MTALDLRPARFAGSWYPGDPDDLRAALEAAAPRPAPVRAPAVGVVVPHAGYRFSLGVAAATLARVEVPPVAVILCPNHTVPPPIVSIWPRGAWDTPLGRVPIEEELAAEVLASCPEVVAEPRAHRDEHAIELILPLLQEARSDVRVVPLVVAEPALARLRQLGEGLARAIRIWAEGSGRAPADVLLVASSDMTHHTPDAVARRQDARALEPLLRLDPAGLYERCHQEGITMCGVRPATVMLYAAKALGARSAEQAAYATSADACGDTSRVVGYAGVVVR